MTNPTVANSSSREWADIAQQISSELLNKYDTCTVDAFSEVWQKDSWDDKTYTWDNNWDKSDPVWKDS